VLRVPQRHLPRRPVHTTNPRLTTNIARFYATVNTGEQFTGFREKSGRKPKKWTMGVLFMLAGEMRHEIDGGARTQEIAAKSLAGREPWKGFLASGQWQDGTDREPWANLLYQYTRMPRHYRKVGTDAYLMHALEGTVEDWNEQVRDLLRQPEWTGK